MVTDGHTGEDSREWRDRLVWALRKSFVKEVDVVLGMKMSWQKVKQGLFS